MVPTDEPDADAFAAGFATAFAPMGGPCAPSAPVPAAPIGDGPLVQLRDVVIDGQPVPAYATDPA